VPLSSSQDGDALLPSNATIGVDDRLDVPPGTVPGIRSSSEEIPMNWNKRVRQVHRWLSIAFVVTVIATTVAVLQEEPVIWVSYTPLLPLALLLLTGLHLFALPYVAKRNARRRTARAS
jgi:hypothetical protein